MDYLVDCDVLSESTKEIPVRAVVHWLSRHRSQSIVTPIILGELEFGILQMPAWPAARRSTLPSGSPEESRACGCLK